MKKLPFDIEAERICLGAALARQDALDTIVDQLDQRYFHDIRHRHIWTALHEFWSTGQRPDVLDIGEHLGHLELLQKAGGMAYLMGIEDEGRGRHMQIYCERVRNSHQRRELIAMSQHILARVENDSIDEILEDASREMSNISSLTGERALFLEEYFLGEDGLIEQYKTAARDRKLGHSVMAGVPTGLNELDDLIGGLAPTRFVVVAARTGVGKTEFLTHLLANHCRTGTKSLVFSMEMDGREYSSRIGGPLVRVHGNRSMSGFVDSEELSRYDELAKNLRGPWKGHVLIYPKAAVKTSQIKAVTRRYIEQHGIKVVYVDHMGLVKGPGKSIYEKMSDISRELKEIAMELNVCVVSACQLNRDAAEGRPRLHQLRDSGAIEQDANQVILLNRRKEEGETRTVWEVDVAKNRHGPKCDHDRPLRYYYDYPAAHLARYVPIQEDISTAFDNLGC